MDIEELEEEIRKKFANELARCGADVKIVIEDSLPPGTESAKSQTVFEFLGTIGRHAVFLAKKGLVVVGVFVTLMQLPDAITEFRVRFPEAEAIVHRIADTLETDSFGLSDTAKPTKNDDYYVYDPRWHQHPVDLPPMTDDPFKYLQQPGVTLVATSGVNPAYGEPADQGTT